MSKFLLLLLLLPIGMYSCSEQADSAKKNKVSIATKDTSDITCPSCGNTETEILPTDQCQIAYNCKNCDFKMVPQGDDCCVYCSYGNHKCPSKQ